MRKILSVCAALTVAVIGFNIAFATVESESNKVVYSGPSTASSKFYFSNFTVYESSDLSVWGPYGSTLLTELIEGEDYNVTLSSTSLPSSGYVMLTTPLTNSTQKVVIKNDPQIIQDLNFIDGVGTPALLQNRALDRLTSICLSLRESIGRAVLNDIAGSNTTSLLNFPSPEPGSVIGWDEDNTLTNLVIANVWGGGGVLYVDNATSRVGINTTTPRSTLDINGNTTIHGNLDFYNPGNKTVIDSSGNAYFDEIKYADNSTAIDNGGNATFKSIDSIDDTFSIDAYGNAEFSGNLTVTGNFSSSGSSASNTYDSGWFAVAVDTEYIKTHSLNTTNALAESYWSSSATGASDVWKNQMEYHEDTNNLGHSIGVQIGNLTNTTITLKTGADGTFKKINSASGAYETAGYARLLMYSLEVE